MNVDFTKAFDKQFQKLGSKRQARAREAVSLFLNDVAAPSLRVHSLKGEWAGHGSLSAGGDLRLHFRMIDEDTVLFVAVGTHSQLYK